MTTLTDDLVPDELWALVAPLLPAPPRPPYGGRQRAIPDRNCFAAILYHHVPGGRGRRATDPHPVGTAPYQARQGPR